MYVVHSIYNVHTCTYLHNFDMKENSFKIHTNTMNMRAQRKRNFCSNFPAGIRIVIIGPLLLHIETQNLGVTLRVLLALFSILRVL